MPSSTLSVTERRLAGVRGELVRASVHYARLDLRARPHGLLAGIGPDATGVHLRIGDRSILAFDAVNITTDVPWASESFRFSDEAFRLTLFGWLGFLTYEAGLAIEGIAPTTRDDVPLPPSRFGLYDTVAIFDHQGQTWELCAVEWPRGTHDDRPPARERLERLRKQLDASSDDGLEELGHGRFDTTPLAPNMSREEYLRRVDRVKRYIEAGDVYQVNLSMRFSAKTTARPHQLYQRLCEVNPATYSSFIQWGNTAIISASPELFLELRDGCVLTRPIKGTRPRTGDPVIDSAARRELETSEKERAELNMIVDLLRNDLGRVCEYGSVRVIDPGTIEELPTVFHRVATIEGRLTPGRTGADLLRATFPGGSITGAPKIRAMQIIDELEPTARGVYCGSIGWIGLDGSMCMNIAIRTMVQIGNTVHLYAGSGIVADSDPQQEYEEIMAKAAGMMRALGAPLESVS